MTLGLKWAAAYDHLISHDADCPPVNGKPVLRLLLEGIPDYFRRHVIWRPTERVSGFVLVGKSLRQAKISKLDIPFAPDEDILELQITIEYICVV